MSTSQHSSTLIAQCRLSAADWRVLKHNQRVLVAEHFTRPLILKVYIGHRSKEWLRSLTGLSRAKRALFGSQLVAQINVATPAIVEYGKCYGDSFIIMDKIEGQGVFDYLDSHPTLPQADRNRLFAALGQLAASLHSNGVVHGDMRPNNALISHGDSAQLTLIDNDRSRRPWLASREFRRNLMQMMMLPDNYISAAERDCFFNHYGELMGISPQSLISLKQRVMNKVYWRFEHEGIPRPDHYQSTSS